MAKYRTSFVTNSSSSSFIIAKRFLTEEQIYKIKHHVEDIERYDPNCSEYDQWSILETEDSISGWTHMDNFYMWEFLLDIGIPSDVIRYEC